MLKCYGWAGTSSKHSRGSLFVDLNTGQTRQPGWVASSERSHKLPLHPGEWHGRVVINCSVNHCLLLVRKKNQSSELLCSCNQSPGNPCDTSRNTTREESRTPGSMSEANQPGTTAANLPQKTSLASGMWTVQEIPVAGHPLWSIEETRCIWENKAACQYQDHYFIWSERFCWYESRVPTCTRRMGHDEVAYTFMFEPSVRTRMHYCKPPLSWKSQQSTLKSNVYGETCDHKEKWHICRYVVVLSIVVTWANDDSCFPSPRWEKTACIRK